MGASPQLRDLRTPFQARSFTWQGPDPHTLPLSFLHPTSSASLPLLAQSLRWGTQYLTGGPSSGALCVGGAGVAPRRPWRQALRGRTRGWQWTLCLEASRVRCDDEAQAAGLFLALQLRRTRDFLLLCLGFAHLPQPVHAQPQHCTWAPSMICPPWTHGPRGILPCHTPCHAPCHSTCDTTQPQPQPCHVPHHATTPACTQPCQAQQALSPSCTNTAVCV